MSNRLPITLVLLAGAFLAGASAQTKSPETTAKSTGEKGSGAGPTLLMISSQYTITRNGDSSELNASRYGFIDLKGKVVIEPQWEGADDFDGGFATVKQNDKWGWIDKTGLHINPQSSRPNSLS